MRKSFFLITLMLVIVLWPSLAGCASGGHTRPRRADAGSVRPSEIDASAPSVIRMDAGTAPSDPPRTDAAMPLADAWRPSTDAGHAVSPAMRESCNGLDDDEDGSVDEDFLCPLGRVGELCVTSCGALGDRRCEAPSCSWSSRCYPRAEECDTIDNNCDGLVDEGCASADPRLMRIALNPALRAECPAGWRIRLWLSSPAEESPRGGVLECSIPASVGPWSSVSLWCDERAPQWLVWDSSDRSALGSGVFSELSLGGVDLRASTMLCEDPLSPGTGFRPILMWDASRRGSCPP